MIVEQLREAGVTSDTMYVAAVASVGLSLSAWALSRWKKDPARSERLAIFVGLWAPTFMQFGNALKIDEEV